MSKNESVSESEWYWSKRGSDERNGPIDWERLKELAQEGDLEPDDLVWTKGMNEWKEAGSVEDLEDLFVSPPPLPEESSQESVEEDAPPSLPQSEKSEAGGELHDENGRESTSEDTATSNSSGSKSEQNSDASDERYWYNKKRWAIPFLWALVPAILWNGYEKYVSGRNEREWFEEYVSLYLQLAWFPPIGWYGLYKTNKTDKVGSVVSVLLSPLLFLGTVYILSYPIAIKKANKFQNERNNIIKSLTESDSLDKAIEKANNYVVSLNMTGRSDKRLSGIYDSLKRAKRSRLDSLKVADIKSKSSLEESIESTKKYMNEDGAGQLEGYEGENFSGILDSLRVEKVKGKNSRVSNSNIELEKKISLAEEAIDTYEKLDNSEKRVENLENPYGILDSLRITDIKSKSSLEESIEAARKYVNEDGAGQPEGYEGENVSVILDSLRVEKIRSIESSVSMNDSEKGLDDKIDMLESANNIYEMLHNRDPKILMARVDNKQEYLIKVSEYGGFDGMRDKSIDLCDDKTNDEVAVVGGADLKRADAERISKFAYEVDGYGKLRDRDMNGAGPFGGIRDRPVTCRVSWERGEPEITYFDF